MHIYEVYVFARCFSSHISSSVQYNHDRLYNVRHSTKAIATVWTPITHSPHTYVVYMYIQIDEENRNKPNVYVRRTVHLPQPHNYSVVYQRPTPALRVHSLLKSRSIGLAESLKHTRYMFKSRFFTLSCHGTYLSRAFLLPPATPTVSTDRSPSPMSLFDDSGIPNKTKISLQLRSTQLGTRC